MSRTAIFKLHLTTKVFGSFSTGKPARSPKSQVPSPVLEYGGEIDSEGWIEAEKLQLWAGRKALAVGRGVADEVVRVDNTGKERVPEIGVLGKDREQEVEQASRSSISGGENTSRDGEK